MYYSNEEDSKIKNGNNRSIFSTIKIFLILLLIILIAFSIAFYVFYNKIMNSDVIPSGIFIKSINVSGLNREQAIEYVNAEISNRLNSSIELTYKNNSYYVELEQIDAKFNIEECVDYALSIGKTGSVFENIFAFINVTFANYNITPTLTYDDEALTRYLEYVEVNLPDQVEQADYYIDDDELVIVNGINGAGIVFDELKKDIYNAIKNEKIATQYIKIPTYVKYPDPIDVDKIHEEVFTEVKDAYFTREPRAVISEVIGVDFNVDRMKEMIANDPEAEEYVIALDYTKPDVTVDDLGMDPFPDLLASFSTNYVTSNTARTTNLRLAASKINGKVVMPGDIFSYNKVVGKRTIAAGYKEAAIYQDGEVTDGLGGGICQISSTLYNASIQAGMLIEERRNHMFVPSYVTGGKDATVVWGSTDFKFSNQREYPIKIVASVSGGVVNVKIYGLRTNEIYDQYRLSIGTKVVKRTSTSLVVESYRDYKDSDGNIVRRDKLYTDTYKITSSH